MDSAERSTECGTSMPSLLEVLYEKAGTRLLFKVFVPDDNFPTGNDAFLASTEQALRSLLRMHFGYFLAHLVHCPGVEDFFESYFAFRSREHDVAESRVAPSAPVPIKKSSGSSSSSSGGGNGDGSAALDSLDRLVSLVSLRVVSASELASLAALGLPTTLTTLKGYAALVSGCKVLRVHTRLSRTMDVCSLLGRRNADVARQYFVHAARLRPAVAAGELAATAVETWSVVEQMSAGAHVDDAHTYTVDIVHALATLMGAATPVLGSSALFDGPGAVSHHGVQLIQALQLIYEVLLPAMRKKGMFTSPPPSAGDAVYAGAQRACIAAVGALLQASIVHDYGMDDSYWFPDRQDLADVSAQANEAVAEALLSAGTDGASAGQKMGGSSGGGSLGLGKARIFSRKQWPELLLSLGGRGDDGGGGSVYAYAGKGRGERLDERYRGAFLADCVRLLGADIDQRLELDGLDAGYFSEALGAGTGLLVRATTADGGADRARARQKAAAPTFKLTIEREQEEEDAAAVASASVAPAATLDGAVSSLKDLFPDYGAGFLKACAAYFDGSAERAIDALLSDNLPPALATIDRRLTEVRVGKGSMDATARVVGVREVKGRKGYKEKVYEAVKDDDFIRAEKERGRLMESQLLKDAALVEQEYADDYDDQFDTPTGGGSGAGGADGGAGGGGWMARMASVRRFNDLLRGAEADVEWWEGMKNTNEKGAKGRRWKTKGENEVEKAAQEKEATDMLAKHQAESARNKIVVGGGGGGGGDVKGKKEKNEELFRTATEFVPSMPLPRDSKKLTHKPQAPKQPQPQQPQEQQRGGEGAGRGGGSCGGGRGDGGDGGRGGGGRGGGGRGGRGNKFRTKQHDKHHQRDKAVRKQG